MPKSSKKVGNRKGRQLQQHQCQTDFTLAEFADATSQVPSARMKKTIAKRWDENVKDLCVKSGKSKSENLDWFDKDLSDFEVEEHNSDSGEEDESEEDITKRTPRKKKKEEPVEKFTGGVKYPYDVWCMIGDYIAPESIVRFASICRSSHTVVHTQRFWNKLYHRYYVEDCGLIEELRPRYMEKAHGLKGRVVRALYYLYTPFVARLHGGAFRDDPDSVVGSKCALMWYKKIRGYCQFYFKFRRSQDPKNSCPLAAKHSNYSQNSLKRFEPKVDYNREQDYIIMQVTAVHFVPVPMCMGLQLAKTGISVGHAMRYHKLKMVFAPLVLLNGGAMSADNLTVVIDQVVSVRVLNWWDPKYPYNVPSSSLTNSTLDPADVF